MNKQLENSFYEKKKRKLENCFYRSRAMLPGCLSIDEDGREVMRGGGKCRIERGSATWQSPAEVTLFPACVFLPGIISLIFYLLLLFFHIFLKRKRQENVSIH